MKFKIKIAVVIILILTLLALGVVYLAAFRGIEYGDFTYNRQAERAFSRGCSKWITQYSCDIDKIDNITLEDYKNPRTSEPFIMRELCEAKAENATDVDQKCFELCGCI